MNPTTKKTVLVVIAIIAVALFVHYMLSPSLSEAFQEGNQAPKKTNLMDTLLGNKRTWSANMGAPVKKGGMTVKMHEKIDEDVKNIDENTFSKMIKNGNLQLKSNDYNSFINKMEKTYKNPYTKRYANNQIQLRAAIEEAAKKSSANTTGSKLPVSGSKPSAPVSKPPASK